ncbi:2-dehydro-3-deoxygalactonokinase [Ferviditalea candida]|uniref:2-dehydro-3-deoxygalactonokinase n=1 Tax=Ferviditalea candida TaxID=3108399 RepID=A0ABU5ZJ34_9BACL|nr:2-dehydro-3-deoxygalactonokinase [Paenibacillaceae bacterium T2]
MVITIDSGTTNSRIRLIDAGEFKVVDTVKVSVGVRSTAIEGNNNSLREGIAEGIKEIIDRNGRIPEDIRYIAASGMITSNLGLYEVPHFYGAAGAEEFAKHSRIERIPEFLNIPAIFVPGFKNQTAVSGDAVNMTNEFDIMRGEEVETLGLLEQMNLKGPGMMILPGSHTKFVMVNDRSQIIACLSTLGGEILDAVSKHTILAKSLEKQLIGQVEKEALMNGFSWGQRAGLSRSLFHIRLLDLFSDMTRNQRANYMTGSVIASDLQAMEEFLRMQSSPKLDWIVIGGSNPLRKAFAYLLETTNFAGVVEATDEQVELSTVIGSIKIAEICLANNIQAD